MLVLTIRTDKPEAEIGIYKDNQQQAYEAWQAHRQLAETLHLKIAEILSSQQKTLQAIEAIVVFQGPGSFTGLRIGISVANALAYSLTVPIVTSRDNEWIASGLSKLQAGVDDQLVLPEYGALPNITQQKK